MRVVCQAHGVYDGTYHFDGCPMCRRPTRSQRAPMTRMSLVPWSLILLVVGIVAVLRICAAVLGHGR